MARAASYGRPARRAGPMVPRGAGNGTRHDWAGLERGSAASNIRGKSPSPPQALLDPLAPPFPGQRSQGRASRWSSHRGRRGRANGADSWEVVGLAVFSSQARATRIEGAVETTVLVIDDHTSFRASARRVLESEGYRVVGEAADGASALSRARELRPQLALVDVYLPDIDGFEVASLLAALDDAPTIVLVSSHDRAELEPCVPGSGARGFLPKDKLSREAL